MESLCDKMVLKGKQAAKKKAESRDAYEQRVFVQVGKATAHQGGEEMVSSANERKHS